MDLRVEDHPHPLQELRRLMQLRKAYNHVDRGDAYMAEQNLSAALQEYEAASTLAPDNDELLFWFAQSLYKFDEKKSLELFQKVFQRDPRWIDLVYRLPAADLLPANAVPKILTQSYQ
jgi:tetratricopeptide (TPR) repeat protein